MTNRHVTSFLSLALSLLASSACTDAAETPGAPATWAKPAPPGLTIGDTEKIGAVTWKYVGQAQYSVDVELGAPGRWVDRPGHWKRTDARSQIIGARQDRADGTLWVAVDVDEAQLADKIAAYPGTQQELGGAASSEPAAEARWVEPASYWYEPHLWDDKDCLAEGWSIPYKLWDGVDGWSVETSPDNRERAAVWILIDNGDDPSGLCNGVVVDGGDDYRDWVLTSAHCLYDSSNNLLHPSRITVCTLGNLYSGASCDAGVLARHVNPDYDPTSWDPGDDIALLRVSLSTSITPHYLSSASDSDVHGMTMRSAAYPVHKGVATCTRNDDEVGVNAAGTILDDFGDGAREMISMSDGIYAPEGSSTFSWYMSGGAGFSGAALWHCGTSTRCGPGDDAFVVSVWSGYEEDAYAMIGPKVHEFRSWALGVID